MDSIERESRDNWSIEGADSQAQRPYQPGDANLRRWGLQQQPDGSIEGVRSAKSHRNYVEHHFKTRTPHLWLRRPVRVKSGKVVYINIRTQVPEWWPCLCNGGWDPCPVCGCGLGQDPPCCYCAPSPIEPGDAGYAAIEHHAELEEARIEAHRVPRDVIRPDSSGADTGPLWTAEDEAHWLEQAAKGSQAVALLPAIIPIAEDDEQEEADFWWAQLLEVDDANWEDVRNITQDVWEGRRAA